MKRGLFTLLVTSLAISAFSQGQNALSVAEKKQGWHLLFDGKSLKGWHAYGAALPGTAWKVEDGALKLDVPERAGNKAKNGGDIVTDEIFKGDFELKI